MEGAKGPHPDSKREMLRHMVATVAYRAEKSLSHAPETFARFSVKDSSRTPDEILAHMGDLFDWSLRLAKGEFTYRTSTPLPWDREVARFFAAVKAFDAYLASGAPLGFPVEKLLQGPVADALTHVGQLAILRRMSGAPIRGESYVQAEIEIGRVGKDQSTKRMEFD